MKPVMWLVALMTVSAVASETAPLTDSEIWNRGVDAYRSGDVTNALAILRPLVLSRTHGERAAEVVAKLCREQADAFTGEEALKLREEALSAAQLALRADPQDARANRNFTRAAEAMPELRREARINAILKAAEGKDPSAMIADGVREARELFAAAATYREKRADALLPLADSLSARAKGLADTWIPIRETIVRSITNEEQAATIVAQIENAETKTRSAAKEFGDLKGEAYSSMSDVEHDFTRFFKLTAMPPAAIAEDLVCQSNAWMDVEELNARSWQQDALDFTRTFRRQFPAWAKAYEEQAAADTNREPFTAEAQARISSLATELEKLQLACTTTEMPPKQEAALGIIREIQSLLPEDRSNSRNQQNDQQNQDGNRSPDQPNRQQQPPPQEGDNPESDAGEGPQNQEEPPEEDKGEEEQDAQEGEQGDQEVEALLKKAEERNDEHEADKRERMRKARLPPNERDW